MRVIVVGAGILGASVAFHLGQLGVSVEVIDERGLGGAASAATFACVNVTSSCDEYLSLRQAGLIYHHELAERIGTVELLHTSGTLRWATDDISRKTLDEQICDLERCGITVERRSPGQDSVNDVERDLDLTGSIGDLMRVPGEGWLEVLPFISHLLTSSGRSRITHRRTIVEDITPRGAGATLVTREGVLSADIVVIAAGVASSKLLAKFGFSLPIRAIPGVLAISAPSTTTLRHVAYGNDIAFRPDGGGRILTILRSQASAAGGTPDIASAQAIAEETLERARQWVPALRYVPLEAVRVGIRPVPIDDRPVLGRLPGIEQIYVTVSHSAITLGPLIGSLVAQEITKCTDNPLLLTYRPDRFADAHSSIDDHSLLY